MLVVGIVAIVIGVVSIVTGVAAMGAADAAHEKLKKLEEDLKVIDGRSSDIRKLVDKVDWLKSEVSRTNHELGMAIGTLFALDKADHSYNNGEYKPDVTRLRVYKDTSFYAKSHKLNHYRIGYYDPTLRKIETCGIDVDEYCIPYIEDGNKVIWSQDGKTRAMLLSKDYQLVEVEYEEPVKANSTHICGVPVVPLSDSEPAKKKGAKKS